jgi:hypothetical protein
LRATQGWRHIDKNLHAYDLFHKEYFNPPSNRQRFFDVEQKMAITLTKLDRSHFIGGSDARSIMGQDEKALIRLW